MEIAGKTVVYSGDTEWSEILIKAVDGADLFICETYYYDKRMKNHLNYKDLVAHRGDLNCRRIIGIDHFFKIGGFGSDHINRGDLVKIAIQRAEGRLHCGNQRQVFHFGDAPQDMQAGRKAGVVPIGVATGVFTFGQLAAAGAETVFPDLKDSVEILQMMIQKNP